MHPNVQIFNFAGFSSKEKNSLLSGKELNNATVCVLSYFSVLMFFYEALLGLLS